MDNLIWMLQFFSLNQNTCQDPSHLALSTVDEDSINSTTRRELGLWDRNVETSLAPGFPPM